MTRLLWAGTALAVVSALGALAACSDDPAGPGSENPGSENVKLPPGPILPPGLVVSDPVSVAGAAAGESSAAALAGDGDAVVYVSLAPGTVPAGAFATVGRVGEAASITTAALDGGFDPVPIGALAGDSIEVRVRDADGGTLLDLRAPVPPIRPPIVVRTDPPRGKTDVSINAAIVIVFSEPVEASTLTPSSVQLLRGTTPIAGTVGLLEGTATTAVFNPAAALDPNTDYRLVVTRAVRDLSGDALADGATVDFTTGQRTTGPVASVTVQPGSATILVQNAVQLSATLRDANGVQLFGRPIAWTSDNALAATVDQNGVVTGVGAGSATVTATSDGVSGTAAITVIVTTGVGTGTVRVITATSGADIDPDGYQLCVDYESDWWVAGGCNFQVTVGPNETRDIGTYAAGDHSFMLEGIAPNCTLSGANPRTVWVVGGTTTDVVFSVACTAFGSLQITTSTTGVDLDATGYTVSVDGAVTDAWRTVAVNGTTTIGGLVAGSYVVTLTDVAANCLVSGVNPRTVSVTGGTTTDVVFSVACTAFGSLQITTSTTGVDLDATGYSGAVSPFFGVDRGSTHQLAVNGTEAIGGLAAGRYAVSLGDVSLNCEVTSAPVVLVEIASGETATVTFVVTCATARQIAFSNGGIYSVRTNGSDLTRLTTDPSDSAPAWSPDGSRIAFTSQRDGNAEIYVMDADGSNPVRLTNDPAADWHAAWSPDGSKIAFASERDGNAEIYVMDANGANSVNLTNHAAFDGDPAWSPDGRKIAFSSDRRGSPAIYVMNANGSGVMQLTTGSSDRPTWSPDGTKIAFSRSPSCRRSDGALEDSFCELRDLYVMNADGRGLTVLVSNSSDTDDPAWSPDGEWIAFNEYYCDFWFFGECSDRELLAVRSDGSDVRWLGTGFQPAWRP